MAAPALSISTALVGQTSRQAPHPVQSSRATLWNISHPSQAVISVLEGMRPEATSLPSTASPGVRITP